MTNTQLPKTDYVPVAPGEVVLIGGGPGDPELLTIAAWRALQDADVILYDRLAPVSVLSQVSAELVEVGKIPRGEFTSQQVINATLIERAKDGQRVVRFKGGDSFVFGRGGEECLALAEARVPFRVIPGVTSSIAGPELAGIPVTHRGLSQGFTVVSAHIGTVDEQSTINWEALAKSHTTLVLLMGVFHLDEVVETLLGHGLDSQTPAAIIERAASPQMRVVRASLEDLAQAAEDAGIQPPAITVIGDVAALELR